MAGVSVENDRDVEPEPITDEELTALALAADVDAPIPDDAVPFDPNHPDGALLPTWYMPAPAGRPGRGRRIVFAGLVCSLLVANVVGFCVTNGFPEFVW